MLDFTAIILRSPVHALAYAIGMIIVWQLSAAIYNLFLHPLRKFPGPVLQRASSLPWAYQHSIGIQAFHTQKLHDRYGPVVRISPNHLSFTDAQAWKDIYGSRTGGHGSVNASGMPKADIFARTVKQVPANILNADHDEHQKYRRALSNGFSSSSMREQEEIFAEYTNSLASKLHERCDSGKATLNIEAWYNWTTFDIAGDLVFGQPFECLANADYHPWIAFIFQTARFNAVMVAMKYVGLGWIVETLFVLGGMVAMDTLRENTAKMLNTRLSMPRDRKDLFEGLVQKREEWNLSFDQLAGNATVLILAGSETTATTLSGVTFLLLKHPDVLRRLEKEIRSSFEKSDDININSVSKLAYMLAVLNEALRMYPPVLSGSVRRVPTHGGRIASRSVAAGTLVEVQQWAANHTKGNWSDPFAFKPERFINRDKESRDNLDALQAFSVGPRNCIGQNLAYAEMRLILARVIFDFDITYAGDIANEDWIGRQKAFGVWGRIPLNVHLTPVAH
ncbi:isotrichodermin C-15 hydroxylase [Colletotrichum truncatum]|uniref:Isotrichodermin C-15 hydroxylase n=1 Tax=Colletotrichum truncatum TaxID=5467 RepID=A0ACC3YN39_COLTU|nr:isotrichodermin C-15 hydroxylase [Colletotrichum truncatum]KAF6789590.1 isotrichodermin C-15 hydroxylase [Colletotrichum truncatum]